MRALIAVVWFGIVGCDDGGTTDEPPPEEEPPIKPPDAGLGAWACEAGELLQEDGSCLAAGIEPEDCPEGFMPTGDRACEPLLLECAPGTMALAGESACRPVAPCPSGKWGDIPVETDTQYVDATFVGGNGTAQAPWSTVQQAVDSASDGAIVAIAAGDYLENVTAQGKRVRLWGVCSDVVIVGTVSITSDQSEVHTLAVSAPSAIALHVGPGNDVLLDRVWVRDAGIIGMDIEAGNPSVR
ncbi:MAG TPA: hypothetical protein VFB62_08840, partial [Polyangiaceae bacterium]|nr:hypothetical protein [Polyangiaceae bacterium]